MNKRLQDIEKQAGVMAVLLDSQAVSLVQSDANPIEDYELNIKISCFISEDSQYYENPLSDDLTVTDEDNDNEVLISLTGFPQSKPIKQPFYFGHYRRDHNYNHWADIEGHPFYGDTHCWSFNQLYTKWWEYNHLNESRQRRMKRDMAFSIDEIFQAETHWGAMLHIGSLWLDVDVQYQYFSEP